MGTVFVLIAAIAFSSKGVMVKLAYRYPVDTETLVMLRMTFALPVFLAIALWVHFSGKSAHLTPRDALTIVLLGITGYYLPIWIDFAGLQYISEWVERVIMFLYPTMVILISALLYGSRIGQRETFALAASYVGVGMAAGAETLATGAAAPHALLGATLVFFSALTYAGYLVASGRLIPRMGTTVFTAYIMLVASIVHYVLIRTAHRSPACHHKCM